MDIKDNWLKHIREARNVKSCPIFFGPLFFMTDSGFNGSARSCTKFYSCASRHCSLGNGIHPEGVALTEVEAVVGSTTVIKVKKEPNKEWWPVVVVVVCRAPPGLLLLLLGWAGFVAAQSVMPIADPLFWGWPKESKSLFQTINGQRLDRALCFNLNYNCAQINLLLNRYGDTM